MLAIAVLFYFILSTPTHAQVGIPTGGVELDGYAWSSNIGWISMNCKTGGVTGNDICATSNYKATVSDTGTVSGYAWSSNIGWIRFGGLSDFPSGAGTMAVNARMTGTYPDLTFEGWVRACAGDDMDASCVPTTATTTATSSWSWTSNTTPYGFRVELMGGIGNSSGIAYGNGVYVAITNVGLTTGNNNIVMTSPDGITWTGRTIPTGMWNAVTFGNGVFVAVSHLNNRVARSVDGITWTTHTIPNNAWAGVTYGNGLFVAVACGVGATVCNNAAGDRVATSPDGITWTSRPGFNKIWNAVTYGGGQFVAVNENYGSGNVMTSPDGITWTARTGPDGYWTDVQYGNGMYVAVHWTSGANIMTSPDAITWTSRTLSGVNGTFGIAFTNGHFVLPVYYQNVGAGAVLTSEDGLGWTSQTYFNGATYFDNMGVVGVGPNSIIVGSSFARATKGTFVPPTYTGTGWDGWISLRSTAAPTHSVVMSSTGASATSYAWGSAVMGWINFDDVRFLAPTATLSGTNCTIPAGASTCNSSFTWNIQNATSPNLRNSTRSVTYTTAAAGTTTPYAITQGANTVQARDNNTVLASVVVTGTCDAGTDFANGSTCEVTAVPAPAITLTTNKSIARTGETVQVSWTITPSPLASGSCALTGPGLPASVTSTGSQNSSALSSKTNFTLVCTGAYGTVRANASVEIIPRASEV